MKYYLIAGEASGDLHASHLMAAIKQLDPKAEFRFFGGDEMQKVGGTLVKHYRELAYMGFVDVALHLRTILRNMSQCKEDIRDFRPDIVIPVDYPGFNLKIARYVHDELKIPVYYYISPKIWAWKEGRIKAIKKYVNKILSILPFEVDYFKKHNYIVDYVGNPSLDEITNYLGEHTNESDLIAGDKPVLALLCGSRKQEIRDNLPLMLEAASAFPQYRIIIAGAPGVEKSAYADFIKGYQVEILFGETYRILHSADAALVTSGTATLETALFGVPQIVCYRTGGGKLFYKIMEKMLKVPYVSLVNLIANKPVVTELLGYKANEENLKAELDKLTNDPNYKKAILSGYAEMREKLGDPGAPYHAAQIIVTDLMKQKH
ncbi:MAG: lipid-A-disaccharide synthase [Bacteroidales bacterium]